MTHEGHHCAPVFRVPPDHHFLETVKISSWLTCTNWCLHSFFAETRIVGKFYMSSCSRLSGRFWQVLSSIPSVCSARTLSSIFSLVSNQSAIISSVDVSSVAERYSAWLFNLRRSCSEIFHPRFFRQTINQGGELHQIPAQTIAGGNGTARKRFVRRACAENRF